jgi:hypothetical protein
VAVLEWIAAGMQTNEINEKAALFKPPFNVSRQQVDWYRKTRKIDLGAIAAVDENNALTTGLSLKEERVKKLQQLAALMEKDLLGGFLWLEQVKSIGAGPFSQVIEYEEFNKGEVDAYRGILDDIAKEVGGRIQRVQEVTWKDDIVQALIDGRLKPEDVKLAYADSPDLVAEFFKQANVST